MSAHSKAPLRVLHVVHTLGDGGADRALTRLVSHTDPRRIRHTILTLQPGAGYFALPPGVQVLSLQDAPTLSRALDRLLAPDVDRADVVHGWVSFASVVAAAYASMVGCRLVLRQPTNIEEEIRWNFDGLRNHWRELRSAFALADCVIVPSPVLEAGTRRVYDVRRVVAIPNAIEPDIPVRWSADRRRHRTRLVVAFAGRLVDQKNPIGLLNAMSQVDPAIDWELRIYGDGVLRPAMDSSIDSKGLQSRVTFMGFRSDWRSDVADVDIFALPTRFEGMCNSLIEAAAAGLPIVTTDIPENRFLLGADAALLVSPDDDAAFARAIGTLARDRGLGERLGATASQIPERFTAAAMIRAHEALYAELAASPPARAA
jgi:glycosyltransferase involved in cell wall biosynthesis